MSHTRTEHQYVLLRQIREAANPGPTAKVKEVQLSTVTECLHHRGTWDFMKMQKVWRITRFITL